MSQWETSWQHQHALVTRTCTQFTSWKCVSNAMHVQLCRSIRYPMMNRRSFLTRQLLLKQFDEWFLDSYLCILEGGKSEIWVFRSMACRRDIVPHSGIMPVSICKVIQLLVAFVMVETAIDLHYWILCFPSSSLFSSSPRFQVVFRSIVFRLH